MNDLIMTRIISWVLTGILGFIVIGIIVTIYAMVHDISTIEENEKCAIVNTNKL